MSIRFLTERDIEAFAREGVTEIPLDSHTRVTDLARETAGRLGIRFVRADESGVEPAPSDAVAESELHQQVRQAVISQLGMAPEGLDSVIQRVLRSAEDAG